MYIFFIIGIGFLIISFLLYKKTKKIDKENIEQLNQYYTIQAKNIQGQIKKLENEYKQVQNLITKEKSRYNEVHVDVERLIKVEDEKAQIASQSAIEKEQIRLKNLFTKMEEDFKKEYEEKIFNLNSELLEIQEELETYRSKREAINSAILREREIEEKETFYRINIDEATIKDIEILRQIEPNLTNKEILNKLIYESFIKQPLTEMEKRVIQGKKIGGIYKITYIKTGESYIGRSVDIGARWVEHVKSSMSIGSIASSTFHKILANKGIWNFTWEILEEVPKEKQNEREKYWIEFYHTDKQFNQKAGG